MKNLYESLNKTIYINQVLEEYAILEGEEVLQINESFKASILKALAKTIQNAERDHAKQDKKEAQRYKAEGYSSTPRPIAKSFASIFGPLTDTSKYGNAKSGIQGIKWDEIEDKDFKLYHVGDKELDKLLKGCYTKKTQANFICCLPGTQTIVAFIKGYAKDMGDVRVYGFKTAYGNSQVTEKVAQKYKYGERPLKFEEARDFIDGLDIYALEITDSMKKEYTELHDTRLASQKGIINYDEESLRKMLKEQKARYQALVKEIKAKKLEEDPKKLMERINKIHGEAIATMEKIISNPENMDEYFDVGRLLSYCSHAYESFYDAFKYKAKANKNTERARQRAKDKGEEFDEEKHKEWNFDLSNAKEKFNDVDEYCKEVEKMIEKMKENLK